MFHNIDFLFPFLVAFGTDHSECDMLVVMFMSHGEQDVLWGRDTHFKPDILFDSFQADQCKSLAGKPKLFFVQVILDLFLFL